MLTVAAIALLMIPTEGVEYPQSSKAPFITQEQSYCMSKRSENMPRPSEAGSNAPARGGNIAIREEYDLAIEANTDEALQLFILRHPEHPLTIKAKEQLQRNNRKY